jgi:hypothetical protein
VKKQVARLLLFVSKRFIQTDDEDSMAIDDVWGVGKLDFSAPKWTNTEFTHTGTDLSLVFPNFSASLLTDCDPLQAVQTISFRVPITIPKGFCLIGFKQKITLGSNRTAGVRIIVVADLGGTVRTRELSYIESESQKDQSDALIDWWVVSPLGLEVGFSQGNEEVLEYAGTIAIIVQRRTKDSRVSCEIDSVDVSSVIQPVLPPSNAT